MTPEQIYETVERLENAAQTLVSAVNRFSQAVDRLDASNAALIEFLDGWGPSRP